MTVKELMELNKEFIIPEALEVIEEMAEVIEVKNCGLSKEHEKRCLYVAKLKNGSEVNLYV